MFYTDQWAFIHIPKTAGSNILARCLEQKGEALTVPWDNSTPLCRHNPAAWWASRTPIQSCQLYCVVRNPYSRAVSLWKDIMYEGGQDATLLDFYNNRPADLFLHWLGNNLHLKKQIRYSRKSIAWDMHSTQKNFVNPETTIFRYESELPLLESKLGVRFTDTRVNAGNYKMDYRYYYSDEAQELVYNLFKEDFIEYGYNINL
jgi:hypothetical protein